MWWLSLFCLTSWLAEPSGMAVSEFLRVPPGKPAEVRELAPREWTQTTSGVHQGHRIATVEAPLLDNGRVPYRVSYNVCLDLEKHGRREGVVPREGLSGVGLSRPTGGNWYAGGCLDVRVNGRSVGTTPARLRFLRYTDRQEVQVHWDAPEATVRVTFALRNGDDKLLVAGEIAPKVEVHSWEVRLRCYPSGFDAPRDRRVYTVRREVRAGGQCILRPGEFWVVYTDALQDAPRGQGPCALLFDPMETARAQVRVSNYPVETALLYPPSARRFHFALWEFPGQSNEEVLTLMRKRTQNLKVPPHPAAQPVKTPAAFPDSLVEDGQPTASIVLSAEANDLTYFAASELQTYLAKMTGATLPLVEDTQEVTGHRLLVGPTRFTPSEVAPPAHPEGFTLRRVGGDTVVLGGGGLGVLYGVYALLERFGVRWFLPGEWGEVVPEVKTLRVGDLAVSEAPDFPMRWIGTGLWSLRNRSNRVGAEGVAGFRILPSVYHSQERLLSRRRYFEDHPEYFALNRGQRRNEAHVKLCTSNPEVARQVAANMAAMLDADPDIDLISLSPTDGMLYCECPHCTALDEAEVPRDQRMSRRMLLFYNRVAKELAKSHPQAQILVGAYHIYTRPPKDPALRAHPNLNVIICHYEGYCLAHPVNDPHCAANAKYRELLFAWQRLVGDVYFYEYYWKVNWMDLPWPIVHTIAQDIPYFHQIGVKGVYTQYNPDNVWTLGLNYYVAARLLWNVNTDVNALLEDFYRRFFGAAAEPMRAYYQTMEEALANAGRDIPGGALANARAVFTEEVLAKMRDCLTAAQQQAREEKVKARLGKIAVSLEYTERLLTYLRLRDQAQSAPQREARARAGAEALRALEALVEEVRTNRAKFGGVVSTAVVRPPHYLARELVEARKRWSRYLRAQDLQVLADLTGPGWKFHLDPEDVGVQEGWFREDWDDSDWTNIEAGRPWEDQGYPDYDGFAWYRRQVELPTAPPDEPV
ncbi:MAG TPA: DUF4838 domain-containing protein, partial [Armatimonadetes bacterium]|nr:DUF4838 domain-containing protein [Armatimonadota bacterium]